MGEILNMVHYKEDTSQERINHRAWIEAMPRVRFVWHRCLDRMDNSKVIGVMWSKNSSALMGEVLYRRSFLLHYYFRWERR